MSDARRDYLEQFSTWLRTLGEDVERVGRIAAGEELPEPARQALVGGVNYLFKSLDLVPDGIDDIGYLDDAFVLRVAVEQGMRESPMRLDAEPARVLSRLGEDAAIIQQFLETDYGRLASYVSGLRKVAARGRSVQDILHGDEVRAAFLSDLRAFAQSYEPPNFAREEKNLVKLRAFFDAKLPR
jgi:uncharacterized membrane protein YkvA (DUF1232 family)